MLILLTGKTGSGKSYQAVSNIVDSLSKDRKCFTNIKINIEDDNYHYLDEFEIKKFLFFIESTFKEVQNLEDKKEEMRNTDYFDSDFFIDEAHLVGFRDKKESILNWLTLQRHFNQNITVITQVASNIHRDYLMMFHSHVDMIPPNKRLSKNMMGFKEFEAYKGERIRTVPFKPKLELFELYNSGNKEVGVSQDVKKIASVFGGLIVVGLILYFMITSLFNRPEDLPTITDDKLVHVNNNLISSSDQNITYPTVICSTNETCFYNGIRYTYNKFVNKVLLRFDNPDKQLLMSSKRYAMYKFTLK